MLELSKEFGYKITAFHHAVEAYMVADLHEWHQRMGRGDFGAPGGCC